MRDWRLQTIKLCSKCFRLFNQSLGKQSITISHVVNDYAKSVLHSTFLDHLKESQVFGWKHFCIKLKKQHRLEAYLDDKRWYFRWISTRLFCLFHLCWKLLHRRNSLSADLLYFYKISKVLLRKLEKPARICLINNFISILLKTQTQAWYPAATTEDTFSFYQLRKWASFAFITVVSKKKKRFEKCKS